MSAIYMRVVSEGHVMLRDKVALENGFSLYKKYAEKTTAGFLGIDYSTLKRRRRAGMFDDKFPYEDGEDGVKYLGIYIADLIIWGTGTWPDEPSRNSPSPNTP